MPSCNRMLNIQTLYKYFTNEIYWYLSFVWNWTFNCCKSYWKTIAETKIYNWFCSKRTSGWKSTLIANTTDTCSTWCCVYCKLTQVHLVWLHALYNNHVALTFDETNDIHHCSKLPAFLWSIKQTGGRLFSLVLIATII